MQNVNELCQKALASTARADHLVETPEQEVTVRLASGIVSALCAIAAAIDRLADVTAER